MDNRHSAPCREEEPVGRERGLQTKSPRKSWEAKGRKQESPWKAETGENTTGMKRRNHGRKPLLEQVGYLRPSNHREHEAE